jgi:hypothetical protein
MIKANVMKQALSLVGAALLFAVAAFCAYSFMASFEFANPGAFAYGYAVVGVGCLGASIALIVKNRATRQNN